MKNQIVGYITGVINSYTNTVQVLNENKVFNTNLNSFIAVKNEFNVLLDYVIDIPEEKVTSDFNMALENENLKQNNAELLNRIIELNELEQSHAYLKDINEKLYRKVENLEIALTLSKSVMDPKFKDNLKKIFAGIK